jgi:hypothetical protein
VFVAVRSAKAGQREWKIGGSGRFESRFCPRCGAGIHVLQHEIPIYAREFCCPKCGEHGDLEVRVDKLTMERNDFEFEASLTCKPCNAKSKVRKVIEKVLSIVSIEIGPTGVKVKGSGKGVGG